MARRPCLVARRQVPAVYRHLLATRRIIAVPFRRRYYVWRYALKAMPDKKPLGAFLGCTGKNIPQTLPFPLLHHRLNQATANALSLVACNGEQADDFCGLVFGVW
jgi:hypothetical protein